MWNEILDSIVKERDYENYRKGLEHVHQLISKVLKEDKKSEIVAYGRAFEKAFGKALRKEKVKWNYGK